MTEQSEIGVFLVILGHFGAWSGSWGINTFFLDIVLTSMDSLSENQHTYLELGQYTSHVLK